MQSDESLLKRALRLAMNGRGLVEPNPMVGCVIVKNDRVIGEGFHQQYGHPHAEPNALANCSESPEGATAYVTLEPCCHKNKQTPPCVPRLIAAKIARVVIGCFDPNPEVNGKGVAQLREAGIAVDGPLLENECKQLIAPFILRTQLHRPYTTMKWAESTDGKIAGPAGRRMRISNADASHQIQLLRCRCDAIVVGINTVLTDDPILLPRGVSRLRPYWRIVLDNHLRLPLDSQLIKTIDQSPVIVCTQQSPDDARAVALTSAGVRIEPVDFWLKVSGFNHVLIEPGPTLAKSLLPDVDRLWVIRSPKIISDHTAPSAAAIPDFFVKTAEIDLDGDVLCEYLNTQSRAFFAAVPSADFVLTLK